MLGSKSATKAEKAHMLAAKSGVCVPCLVRVTLGLLPPEWAVVGHDGSGAIYLGLLEFDHKKSGNIRRGHLFGWGSCSYHHRGVPQNNMTLRECRDRWGVSLADGSSLFHATYGDDDSLIEIQQHVLAERGA